MTREEDVRAVYANVVGTLASEPTTLPIATEHLGTCWVTASYLAERLQGEVWGYLHVMNPAALIGMLTHGHDFAVIDGRWILDWWATRYGGTWPHPHRGLLDLHRPADAAEALLWYGDRRRWELSESFVKETPPVHASAEGGEDLSRQSTPNPSEKRRHRGMSTLARGSASGSLAR